MVEFWQAQKSTLLCMKIGIFRQSITHTPHFRAKFEIEQRVVYTHQKSYYCRMHFTKNEHYTFLRNFFLKNFADGTSIT